jgi:hypothetical protein
LLIKPLDLRWEKPVQAKLASFVFRERRAFVQPWAVEEIHPARNIRPTRLFYRLLLSHVVLPFSSLDAECSATYRKRLTSARSTISSPRPLRTAFNAKRLKPFICSKVIVGGIRHRSVVTTGFR